MDYFMSINYIKSSILAARFLIQQWLFAMMQYKNLTIIGTSHIARQSLEEVEMAIEQGKPDIVALELDRKRLYALMNKQNSKISLYDIRRVGLKGFIFSLIGAWAEKKLGKMVGVAPGSEMKKAIMLAQKNNKEDCRQGKDKIS